MPMARTKVTQSVIEIDGVPYYLVKDGISYMTKRSKDFKTYGDLPSDVKKTIMRACPP